MCHTNLISDSIVRLSTRSYRQRLDAAKSDGYSAGRLARLNKDLDNFYELLYSQWQTVTAADYSIFGEQLNIMLETLKGLLKACKKLAKQIKFGNELKRLEMNYSAIYELNSDIVNFKIKMPNDSEIAGLMSRASQASKNLAR